MLMFKKLQNLKDYPHFFSKTVSFSLEFTIKIDMLKENKTLTYGNAVKKHNFDIFEFLNLADKKLHFKR